MNMQSKLIAGLLAAGIALPALAQAQQPMPPAPPAAAADAKGQPPKGPGPMRGHRPDRPSALWAVSSRLAAAETALGITDAQQDAWNGFTAAVVGYVEAGRPQRGPRADAPPPPADEEDAAAITGDDDDATSGPDITDSRPFARVERMLDRRIRQGDAAATLQGAMVTLAGELTPEQTRTAEALLRELPRPGKGPHGGHDRRGGPDRDDRRGPGPRG